MDFSLSSHQQQSLGTSRSVIDDLSHQQHCNHLFYGDAGVAMMMRWFTLTTLRLYLNACRARIFSGELAGLDIFHSKFDR